ncbi:hypothetical protein [Streptomyces sp. SID8499]|uniref:hypothetical protein n=1 Tax=Streptomyces sp. SID8499 TaxID=2706106 RepID=UPI0013C6FA0D|nr:hypothetical protein [Streptomyces sp. SID8499]NED31045.1 hypothetical protein [Streptomyces sp. SID8499]
MSIPNLIINGAPVPLDEIVWVERRPCGCLVSAVVAVGASQVLATAGQVRDYWHPTEADRRRADAARLTVEPVTAARYRREFRTRWHCDQHATPAL